MTTILIFLLCHLLVFTFDLKVLKRYKASTKQCYETILF